MAAVAQQYYEEAAQNEHFFGTGSFTPAGPFTKTIFFLVSLCKNGFTAFQITLATFGMGKIMQDSKRSGCKSHSNLQDVCINGIK
mmetsp:Transcript_1173/g.1961  ORF Transcript_1173/g.1961 Transcript_1173/m.1961 type:complete len:85 (+) Transcript_1173:126-380(+)